jgi:hypothetical protein
MDFLSVLLLVNLRLTKILTDSYTNHCVGIQSATNLSYAAQHYMLATLDAVKLLPR